MKQINRRLLLSVLLVVTLIGIAGILFYSLPNYAKDNARKSGMSVKGRPSYVSSFAGSGRNQLRLPLNIGLRDEFVYVTDSGNGRILVFSKTGTFEQAIDPAPDTTTASTLGVAIDQQRRIYAAIADSSGNTIKVFNASGRFLYAFPEGARGDGTYIVPGKPVGMVAADNKLYVTDIVDHDVKVYSVTGELLLKFGRPGNAKGEFLYPNGIAVDARGAMYISDSNNGRVQVFDSKGEFSHLFAPSKKEPLALPRGIAIDRQGQVHVVDALKHKVFVFTKEGKFLYTYGEFGTDDGELSYPNGIAIDSKRGTIFITDKMNNRVAVWK